MSFVRTVRVLPRNAAAPPTIDLNFSPGFVLDRPGRGFIWLESRQSKASSWQLIVIEKYNVHRPQRSN